MKILFKSLGLFCCALILHSCDKGPDYGKMRPSMMDIAGAKSIGFINEGAASRGEALSSGLYKIDADGNISAVAVYFSEDGSKHEDKVTLSRSREMINCGTDYIFFGMCDFVDKNDRYISGLPYDILVRKSDGKMWSLDDIGINFHSDEKRQFCQGNDGTLYYYSPRIKYQNNRSYNVCDKIYKFNLKTEPASIEQITANVEIEIPFAVDSKGIICGPINTTYPIYNTDKTIPLTFAWQNSGFQKITMFYTDIPYKKDYSEVVGCYWWQDCNYYNSAVCFNGHFYLICSIFYQRVYVDNKVSDILDYPFVELGVCTKLSIEDTPGSAKIDDSKTINIKNDIGSNSGYVIESVITTDDYILTSGVTGYRDGSSPWITALNPETKVWKWVTETPDLIKFDKTINYNNRYWVTTTIDENCGAWWIDIKTLETGFVKFNEEIPSYMDKSKYEFAEGKVIYSGVNPADSHEVKIAFDLMTGNAVTNDNAPVYKFSTLVSLN